MLRWFLFVYILQEKRVYFLILRRYSTVHTYNSPKRTFRAVNTDCTICNESFSARAPNQQTFRRQLRSQVFFEVILKCHGHYPLISYRSTQDASNFHHAKDGFLLAEVLFPIVHICFICQRLIQCKIARLQIKQYNQKMQESIFKELISIENR